MIYRRLLVLLSFALLMTSHIAAQVVQAPALPATEAGQRVKAYITAFNSGDEQSMRAFLTLNVSEDAIKRRSIDERVEIYREMRSHMKSLELYRVLADTPSMVTCLFRTGNGNWVEIGFQFEDAAPHKLLGLRVEDTDPPSDIRTPAQTVVELQSQISEAEFLATVEKQLNDLVAADQFSGAVLIAKNGKPIFQRAYGLASKEYNVANRSDTRFNLGSINKLFTQVAIGQLIEQGKLTFDDTVSKHLSDYPNREAVNKITIQQLLSMKSGIGDIFGDKYDLLAKDKLRTIKDYIPLFANAPLEFVPGTKQQYSNGGYIVLGAIIEKLSGQTYYEYVREHIFKVAGMENTDSYEEDIVVPNRASGYTMDGSTNGLRRNNFYSRPARGSSAGGGYSTLEDLLKFTIAVASNKIRIPNFRSPAPTTSGGNSVDQGIAIAGGSPGTNALLTYNPKSGFAVIVLSNYDPPAAETIAKQIRELLTRVK